MIIIYIETPNKFDMSYGTNITDKAVLDEMSAIEDLMDPNKDDKGEQDNIAWVLSISTFIKEINQAPSNVWDASVDELDPLVDPGPFPGDSEYAIPDDQDDIDQIVEGIPEDTKKLLVMDTNNDPGLPIWDSAWILLGVHKNANLEKVMNRIDNIIDKYYVDTQASGSDYNSKHEWWNRIATGEIHCQMTNLGYVNSYEAHYGAELMTGVVFVAVVLLILMALAAVTLLMLLSRKRREDNNEGNKKNLLFALIVFAILIAANVFLATIDTTDPDSNRLNDFSNVFEGGQMGLIVIRGSPAPPDDEPFINSQSMKDIEVLDNMERFEDDLENTLGSENLNSPLTIIDIMKMIKVPESMVNQIPMELIPAFFQSQIDEILNSSFWDAIHIAGEIDSVMWFMRYDKSLQDTLINIFYKSITPELRWTFVNEDYSRSLFYIQLPMKERDQSEDLIGEINSEVASHRPFIAISNVALVSSDVVVVEGFILAMKVIGLFIILLVGILMFILLNFRILDYSKKKKEEEVVIEVQGEAIFEDITDEEDPYYDDDSYYRPPEQPPYRP